MKYLLIVILAIAIAIGGYMWWLEKQADYKYAAAQPWMEEQINRDLEHYAQRGITDEMLATAREAISEGKLPQVSLISITDKGVTAFPKNKSKRVKMIINRIDKIKQQGAKIPNVSFLLGDHDHWNLMDKVPKELRSKLPPIFVFAASKLDTYRSQLVLFPDDHTLGDHLIGYRRGWSIISHEILANQAHYPWEHKQNIAFWRGLDTDTDGYANPGDSPRSKLVALATQYPQFIDAKFTHTVVANSFVIKTLRPLMLMFSITPYISQVKQLEYKILLNLDGHTATYPGLLWRLLSGCVTLKQETANEQWFYGIVKAWEHYVPMEKELGDIIPKIEWILSHDREAHAIAQRAGKLVQQSLMIEHIDAYIILLLQRYEALMR